MHVISFSSSLLSPAGGTASLANTNTQAPPQAASAVFGAMPLTASTAGKLDVREGPTIPALTFHPSVPSPTATRLPRAAVKGAG
jgi:hypothetical protein